MKRERMLQVVLGLVGLVYVALIYPLYTDLAHSKWLLEMKDACEPMFLRACNKTPTGTRRQFAPNIFSLRTTRF